MSDPIGFSSGFATTGYGSTEEASVNSTLGTNSEAGVLPVADSNIAETSTASTESESVIDVDNDNQASTSSKKKKKRNSDSSEESKKKKRRKDGKARDFLFTWNNWNEDSVKRLENFDKTSIKYIFAAEEVSSGKVTKANPLGVPTPHLQGMIMFKNPRSEKAVRKLLIGCHVEIIEDAFKVDRYCRKGTTMTKAEWEKRGASNPKYGEGLKIAYEYGDPPPKPEAKKGNQGQRNEHRAFLAEIQSVLKKIHVDGEEINLNRHLNEFAPEICAKNGAWVQERITDLENDYVPGPPSHDLKDWQQDLTLRLQTKPDGRSVITIIDYQGHAGKTFFVRDYQRKFPFTSAKISPGAKKDLATILVKQITGQKTNVIFLDAPRCKCNESIQWDLLEQLLDGTLVVTKYNSVNKDLSPPHIVVFMNEEPDYTKMSLDRWKVFVFPKRNDETPLRDENGHYMYRMLTEDELNKRLSELEKMAERKRNREAGIFDASPPRKRSIAPEVEPVRLAELAHLAEHNPTLALSELAKFKE